jgi:hypothetical protein
MSELAFRRRSVCTNELFDTFYKSEAVKIHMCHIKMAGTYPKLMSLRRCHKKNCIGRCSVWPPQWLDHLPHHVMWPVNVAAAERHSSHDLSTRRCPIALPWWSDVLTWMNVFLIVGSVMETLWNDLQDRLIWYRWAPCCWILWKTLSIPSPNCRRHCTSSRHGSKRPEQKLINKSLQCVTGS